VLSTHHRCHHHRNRHRVLTGILPHVPVASGALFDARGGELLLQEDEAQALALGQQKHAASEPILLSFPHTITFPPSACGYGIMGFDVSDDEGEVVGFSGWCGCAHVITCQAHTALCRVMQCNRGHYHSQPFKSHAATIA
jgi:hypothetical protein